MKSSMALLFVLSVLAVAAPVHSNAQGLCGTPPDCPGDAWIGPQTISRIVQVSPGVQCTLYVTFCYRTACGVWNDMKILYIGMSPECLGSLTPQQMLWHAMQAVWCEDPWATPPEHSIPECPEYSNDVWRVYTATCWTSIIHPDPPPPLPPGTLTLYPCETPGQCWAKYRLCRKIVDGKCIIESQILYQGQIGDCVPDPQYGECFIICPGDEIDPWPLLSSD